MGEWYEQGIAGSARGLCTPPFAGYCRGYGEVQGRGKGEGLPLEVGRTSSLNHPRPEGWWDKAVFGEGGA